MLDFPLNPNPNQIHPPLSESSVEGRRWVWDGEVWLNYAGEQQYTLGISNVYGLSDQLSTKVQKTTNDLTPVNAVRCLTQSEYDALSLKDSNTLYFIK